MFIKNYESLIEKRFNFTENNVNLFSSQILLSNNDIFNFNISNNISNNINEEDKFDMKYSIPSYYLINQEEIENNNKKTQITNKDKEKEPKLYTSFDILNIFNKESNKNKFSEDLKKLNFKEDIEDDLNFLKKKRKKTTFLPFNSDNFYILIDNKHLEFSNKTKKRGRKTNKIFKTEVHDRKSVDNIIKRIKSFIFKYPLFFLNKILKANNISNLVKLNYRFVNRLKKDEEIKLLDMSLKDLFSKEISPIYNSPKDYNKKIIECILNNKKTDETVLFAFNMTLREWLDLFTFKKSIKDIINENNKQKWENIDYEKIERYFVGVDKLLYHIKEKDDADYLSLFIFCLYNYERWFFLKKGRKRQSKSKKEIKAEKK